MTDKQICDAIGKQAALAAIFAVLARRFTDVAASMEHSPIPEFQESLTKRAKHFHNMSLQFAMHTLRLLATHRAVVESQLKEIL